MLPARDRITDLRVYPTKADAIANTNGTSYTQGIVEGTARIERTFFTALPAFGECNASMFECELDINVDLKGKWIRVATKAYATDASTSRTTYWLFCGLVDDCKYDVRQATRKLVAYDEMYSLRSIDVSTWWRTWWSTQTGTVAVGTALSAMMTEYGVQGTAASSLANYFGIYAEQQQKGMFGGGSFAQVLSYIGLVCSCSFYFDVSGKLNVCLYSNVNKTNSATAIDANVDTVNSSFGDAAGETFGSAQINVGSNAAYRSGNSEPTFAQNNNPLLSGYNATNYMTIATQLYAVAQKMSGLKAAEIEFVVSSPDIALERTQAISYGGETFMPSGIALYGSQLINETMYCTGEMSDAPMYQGAVTEENIVDGAVTADKIRVSDLSALGATIGGWTIDEHALKNTVPGAVGGDNGVWLNAPPSGSLTNASAMNVRNDEDALSIKYDGSLISTQNLTGVHQQTTKLDDGELFVERKYYKTEGDWSSEWRRGETNINGAEIEVVNSKRDNTEARDEPLFRGELSGYSNNAVVSVEANTTNGRSEVYAIAEDQSASLALVAYDVLFSIADGRNNRIRMERADIWSMWYSGNKTYVTHISEGSISFFSVSGDQRNNRPSTPSDATVITASSIKANGHDLLRMTPQFAQMFATAIPSSANLNTTEYLAIGQYYAASSAIAASLTNSPTATAFSMTVSAPISTTYDDESASGEAYRIRKITVLGGEEWVQYCYKTSTTWTYGTWMQVSIGVSEDTYTNTAMKAGNLVARRNGNVVTILSTGNATSVASGNWRTYVTIAAKYRPKEETPAIVTNAYGEIKTARIRTNGNVDLYTGTTISSASNFSFTATYIV